MQTPDLLKNVWPVTAAGQHLHLLHVNAQALLDPLEAVCVQGGGAKEERGSQVGGAQPPPQHWWVWPEIPSSLRICHLTIEAKSFVVLWSQTKLLPELTYPSLDCRWCQWLHISNENMRLGHPYQLLQRLHVRAGQGDKPQAQPRHVNLNLGL